MDDRQRKWEQEIMDEAKKINPKVVSFSEAQKIVQEARWKKLRNSLIMMSLLSIPIILAFPLFGLFLLAAIVLLLLYAKCR